MQRTGPLQKALKWTAVAATGVAVAGVITGRITERVHATDDERSRPLPGDDLIANPVSTFTNAMTVHAAPRDVWPWLAQMGAGRADWYSYEALDNGGAQSARRINPELQHLIIGMVFPAGPAITEGFTLVAFDRERLLILDWKTPDGVRLVSWAFVLEPLNGATRLIVRVHGRLWEMKP